MEGATHRSLGEKCISIKSYSGVLETTGRVTAEASYNYLVTDDGVRGKNERKKSERFRATHASNDRIGRYALHARLIGTVPIALKASTPAAQKCTGRVALLLPPHPDNRPRLDRYLKLRINTWIARATTTGNLSPRRHVECCVRLELTPVVKRRPRMQLRDKPRRPRFLRQATENGYKEIPNYKRGPRERFSCQDFFSQRLERCMYSERD